MKNPLYMLPSGNCIDPDAVAAIYMEETSHCHRVVVVVDSHAIVATTIYHRPDVSNDTLEKHAKSELLTLKTKLDGLREHRL